MKKRWLVACECRGLICRRSPITGRLLAFTLRYQCVGCKRRVPWCFGAADDLFELCDDCAMVVNEAQAQADQ